MRFFRTKFQAQLDRTVNFTPYSEWQL